MPKYITGILLTFLIAGIIVFSIPPNALAAALTQTQIQAVIGLLQAFGADSSVIANVQSTLSGGASNFPASGTPIPPTPSTPSTPPSTGYAGIPAGSTFSRNLTIGSEGKDVSWLKIILTQEGCFSYNTSNTVFGPLTQAGVRCFQIKYQDKINQFADYQISTTGSVGTATRAFLNSLISNQQNNGGNEGNTPPNPACTPNWKCGWGPCTNGYQSQIAIDYNNCRLPASSANIACPALAQICTPSAQPSVTILSPNGGETYRGAGSVITVNWKTDNVPATFRFDVVRLRGYPNGQEYNLATNVLNSGKEVVSIPSNLPDGAYTLEIKAYLNDILVMDSSDSYFKIVSQTPSCPPIQCIQDSCPGRHLPDANGCISCSSPCPETLSITVLSPNGGETWQLGTIKTIKWQDNTPVPLCGISSTGVSPTCGFAPRIYDIKLTQPKAYCPPCAAGTLCSACLAPIPYTIAKSISGYSYSWGVGKVINDYISTPVPEGAYTVQICQTGTSNCDSSDSYFKIISSTSTNLPPVISGGTFPTTLSVNQTGTWIVNASDPENGPLTYDVAWGDTFGSGYAPQTANLPSQTSTFTHSYSSAGTYTVTFTVKDNGGLTAQTSSTVQVGNSTKPDLTISGVQCTPASPKAWEFITCDVTVLNNSDVDINTPFAVNIQGTAVTIFSLAARASKTVTAPKAFGLTIIGNNQLNFPVDIWNSVDESNENNNTFTMTIVVQPATSPTQPSITIISPNGGETLSQGQTYTIKWNSTGVNNVNINLTPNNGGTQYIIAPVAVSASAGNYSWTVPSYIQSGTTYKIIIGSDDGKTTDYSDNNFTIISPTTQPSITIISPNSGTPLTKGLYYTFQTSGASDLYNVAIKVSDASGSVVKTLTASVVSKNSNFQWMIPPSWSDGVYTISATSNGNPVAITNNSFSVVSSTSTQPSVYAESSPSVPAQNILANTPNQILGGFDVTVTGEPVVIKGFPIGVTFSCGASTCPTVGNASLYQNGTLVDGPVTNTVYPGFTNSFTLPVGKTTFVIKGQINLAGAVSSNPGMALNIEPSRWQIGSNSGQIVKILNTNLVVLSSITIASGATTPPSSFNNSNTDALAGLIQQIANAFPNGSNAEKLAALIQQVTNAFKK